MNFQLTSILKRLGSVIVFACLLVQVGSGQQMEQNVKAAFIYNFTKYVIWPTGTFGSGASPIVIGIVGHDSLGGAMESTVNGKSVEGRQLIVRHYRWDQDLSSCNVLFVPASEMASANRLLPLKQRPVLTIGESPGFAKRFGIINFVLQSNRVRFEINADSAKLSGITLSSKLLSLGIRAQ